MIYDKFMQKNTEIAVCAGIFHFFSRTEILLLPKLCMNLSDGKAQLKNIFDNLDCIIEELLHRLKHN